MLFCRERLYYLSKRRQERKMCFCRIISRNCTLRAQKVASMALFTPVEGQNERGKRQVGGERNGGLLELYWRILQENQLTRKRRRGREKHFMEFFKNSKSEFLRTHSKTNILIINTLNMSKSLQKSFIENPYRVKMGQGQIGSFWKGNVIFCHSIIYYIILYIYDIAPRNENDPFWPWPDLTLQGVCKSAAARNM